MPREVIFTQEQLAAAQTFYDSVQETCDSAEDASALVIHVLTEFLLQVVTPEALPAAVEETIQCIRMNTGVYRG
jgi:hypothetical protein